MLAGPYLKEKSVPKRWPRMGKGAITKGRVVSAGAQAKMY